MRVANAASLGGSMLSRREQGTVGLDLPLRGQCGQTRLEAVEMRSLGALMNSSTQRVTHRLHGSQLVLIGPSL